MHYKHTQISYLMIVVTLATLVLFAWAYITTANEPPSADSGNNLLVTGTMIIILGILASLTSLHVSIDRKYLRIKFGIDGESESGFGPKCGFIMFPVLMQ